MRSLSIIIVVGVILAAEARPDEPDTEAVVVEADSPASENGKTVQSKFFLPAGNDALGGAALGLGVGVVGSLLVGALLDNHGCRGKRAEPSARFLPGLLPGGNCPPPGVGYPQPGYSGPGFPSNGYAGPVNPPYLAPTTGYGPGYPRNPGYNSGNGYNNAGNSYNSGSSYHGGNSYNGGSSYHGGNSYNNPAPSFVPSSNPPYPSSGYSTNYNSYNNGYNSPNNGYNSYNNGGYVSPSSGYVAPSPYAGRSPSHSAIQNPTSNIPIIVGLPESEQSSVSEFAKSAKTFDKSVVNFGN